MTQPGPLALTAVFLRSFTIQASWNYRTLLGGGFGFALLPALRRIHGGDPAALRTAVERHTELFNSHPYLAPLALGAVVRLEADGEDGRVIERFKAAIRGSLGTLGDRLVWAGWRPVCLLFAIALVLAGGSWWAGIIGFLVVYNLGHLILRAWTFRVGLREGMGVGDRLRRSALGRWQRGIPVVGAFLVGLVLPPVVVGANLRAGGLLASGSLPGPWIAAAALGAVLGARFGGRIRTPVILALAGFALLGLLLRIVQ